MKLASDAIMIRPRYLPGSIVARKVSAREFSHSLDPEATFVKLVTSRHDGAPSNNIQVAGQEMCVLRRSKCALTVRNGTGPGFSSPNQPDQERTTAYRDSSGPDSLSDAHYATIIGDWEEPSGESRSRPSASSSSP